MKMARKISKFVMLLQLSLSLLITLAPVTVSYAETMQTGELLSNSINPETGQPYGDIMQYEWPFWGYDGKNAKASPGPAPNKPDILWIRQIPGGGMSTYPMPFNGKVFLTVGGGGIFGPPTPPYLYALDAFTGEIIYKKQLPEGPALFQAGPYKIADNYMVYHGSRAFYCLRIDTGDLVWNVTGQFVPLYWPGNYYSEKKLLFTFYYGADKPQAVVCYDLSNPAQAPPVKWTAPLDEYYEVLASGDGMVFLGSRTWAVVALNATTGQRLWRTQVDQMLGFSGTYYNGRLLAGCLGTKLYCFNATTGKIIWEYTYGHGGSSAAQGGCAAYGRFYIRYIDPEGGNYFACFDIETGEKLWEYVRPGYIGVNVGGYVQPVVADGKVYTFLPRAADDPNPYSTRFACFDAFSGALLWEIPANMGNPTIGYGNIYGYGGTADSPNSVICIGPPKPWSMFYGNTETPRIAQGQSGPSQLNLRWKFKTDGPVTSSPAVVDGKVYIGSHDKNLYCLDAYTGQLIWKFLTGYKVLSSPAVVNGKVYTGADDGYVYCLNATTGAKLWSKRILGESVSLDFIFMPTFQPRSSPLVVGNRVYVGAIDGKMYCLDANNGNILWSYTTAYPIGSSPLYYESAIYFESCDGYLYCLNATTGALIWKTFLPGTFGYTSAIGSVGAGGGRIYAGMEAVFGSGFMAFDAKNGTLLWNVPLIGFMYSPYVPLYLDGTVFMQESMGYVSLFNATNGKKIWTSKPTAMYFFSSAAYADDVRGGKFYFGCEIFSVIALNKTGSKISWYETGSQVQSSPAIWEGKVYVGSADWHVYCFDDAPTVQTKIVAWCDWKEAKVGENIIIHSRLMPGGIPNEQLILTLIKPDGSTQNITATTDSKGWVQFSFQPDMAGNWTWIVWYQGSAKKHVFYGYAFTDANTLKVVSTVTEQGVGPAPALPTEAIYATVAIIIVIIIAIAAYTLRKHKK